MAINNIIIISQLISLKLKIWEQIAIEYSVLITCLQLNKIINLDMFLQISICSLPKLEDKLILHVTFAFNFSNRVTSKIPSHRNVIPFFCHFLRFILIYSNVLCKVTLDKNIKCVYNLYKLIRVVSSTAIKILQ